jgi:hypothetical protein
MGLDGLRADAFIDQVRENRKLKRRNSFHGDFSVTNFYSVVKVKSQRIFHYASYGSIDKIIEIKNLNVIAE